MEHRQGGCKLRCSTGGKAGSPNRDATGQRGKGRQWFPNSLGICPAKRASSHNGGDGGGVNAPSWVNGWEDFNVNNTDNTNMLKLATALLGPYYSKQTKIYHCPADIYTCIEGNAQLQRVRSNSMNRFVEGDAYRAAKASKGLPANGSIWYSAWRAYTRLTDIVRPASSDLFVFVDEHPDSINDGWMMTNVTDPNNWTDLPASYHGNACGFGFADGHSEIHRWRDPRTFVPVKKTQYNGFNAPGSKDIQWMFLHCSAPL